jgi:hypothetical protein
VHSQAPNPTTYPKIIPGNPHFPQVQSLRKGTKRNDPAGNAPSHQARYRIVFRIMLSREKFDSGRAGFKSYNTAKIFP